MPEIPSVIPEPQQLYEDEQRALDIGIRGVFDPAPPAGISFPEHLRSLPLMIGDMQNAIWQRTNSIPRVVVVGAVIASYLTADRPLTAGPPTFRLGNLFQHTEVFVADDGDFNLAPGEAWLLFARYHEIDGQTVLGSPVATLQIMGYEEHPLKRLARQAP